MKTYLFQPLSTHHTTKQAVATALSEALELTQWLDSTGHITGILFNEGHIDDYNFCNKDSVLLAAMALARTQSVEVGACVVQLALNDPKLVFERLQQLQLMFPGRFVMGVGNGFHQAEGLEFGLDQNARRAIADFNRDVLTHLIHGHSVQCRGLHGNNLRKIHPGKRHGNPDASAYFDSVGSLIGAQNAIQRRNNFILNLSESEEHCSIEAAQQIFEQARAVAPELKRYLFLPTFVYEDPNTERLFLQYYNLYRKLIYRGHLVDSEFLCKRAQRNDFFLVGNEDQWHSPKSVDI
jgi:hypothetical protein